MPFLPRIRKQIASHPAPSSNRPPLRRPRRPLPEPTEAAAARCPPAGRRLVRVFLAGLAVAAGTGASSAAHAGILPYYSHYETVTNNTGTAANDITLQLQRAALNPYPVSIAAPAFAGGTATGANTSTVTITGPAGSSVPNGGSTTVGWVSAVASDLLLNTSFWTNNGANIGPVTTNNAISWNVTENGDGTITVALSNTTGSAVSYSALDVDDGAPIADLDPGDAYDDMGLGTSVATLIASAGLLPTGITDITTFTPSAFGYEGESITIDGYGLTFLGEAEATAVPEPSSIEVQFAMLAALAGLLAWRPRVRAGASTAG
jgi:hypothetical protein